MPLDLLRQWGKYLDEPLASYLRGTVWNAAGDPATAAVFLERASGLDPGNGHYEASLIHTLKTADPREAVERADVALSNSDSREPAVVLFAAEIRVEAARGMFGTEATQAFRGLIPILEHALAKLEADERGGPDSLTGMALALLALCHRGIGNIEAAYGLYSRAIQIDPNNDDLLTARGMLVYGTDPGSPADFEQAVQLGSKSVWPYLCLAHHYLTNNRFDECRSMCERALRRPASKRVQSELWEFFAISLSGLEYPHHEIRRAFKNSMRIDPSNDRARQNLETFEMAVAARNPAPKSWQRRSESSLRAFANGENDWPAFASIQTTANV